MVASRVAFMLASSLLLSGLLVTPQVGAQSSGALYLTADVEAALSGCDGTPTYAMAEDVPAAGKAYSALTAGGFACAFAFLFTATEANVLTGDLTIAITVGCDAAGHAIEMDYNFLVAGTSVTSARPAVSWTCDGPGSEFPYTQTFGAKDTPVAVGDEIRITFSLFAAVAGPSAAGNWYVKTGGASGASGVFGAGLPGSPPLAGDAPPAPVALNGTVAEIDLDVANATEETRTYTWTTNLTNALLAVNATVGNGSFVLTVLDAANTTVANRTVATSSTTRDNVTGATAGNWSITLGLHNFTGRIRMSLGAPGASGGFGAAGLSNATGGSGPGSGTGNGTSGGASGAKPAGEDETKAEAPGPGLAMLLLTLAVATIALRRRKA